MSCELCREKYEQATDNNSLTMENRAAIQAWHKRGHTGKVWDNRLVITFGGKVLFDGEVDKMKCTVDRPMPNHYLNQTPPQQVPPATVELEATWAAGATT